MKNLIFVLIMFFSILISGCVDNPMRQVPIVEVNITFAEKEGFLEAVESNFSQGTINFLNRPKEEQLAFPVVAARTTIQKGKNSTMGPWVELSYTGQGTYAFNIGFVETKYPDINDSVFITVYVFDEKGERIGFVTKGMLWK